MNPEHAWWPSAVRPYILALLLCLLMALIRASLLPLLGFEAPLIIFIMPVVLSAWYGGAGPGLLATLIGALLGIYLFIAPAHSLHIMALSEQVRLGIFLVEGVTISTLSELRQRSERRARAHTQALRQSEERFQLLVDGVTDYAIYMLDPEGRVTSWNTGAARIKGYQSDEILGAHIARFYEPEDVRRGLPELALQRTAATGRYEEEGWRVRRDGTRFQAHTVLTALHDEGGELRGFAKVTHDITGRLAAETRLRSSEAQLAGVVESAMDAIITVDAEQRIVLFNRAAEQMFGYSVAEACGMPLASLIPEPARAIHRRHIAAFGHTGETSRSMHGGMTLQALRRDQTTFPIEASISHITVEGRQLFTAIIRDVSARKQLEAQFLQVQKMEVVGQLAGGIAHDFNNLLTIIQGYSEFMQEDLPPDSPLRADLGQVLEATAKATALTGQLLTFARQQPLNPRSIVVNQLIDGLVKLLGRLLGSDISLVTQLGPDDLHVLGDAGQLEQVLVNLCVNARDAMPSGGAITITAGLVAGRMVRITVRDTGTGMPPEVLDHIFEPFFSTKPAGQGTGLGLSTCYGIIKQHGGAIRCVSELGRGTAFTIDLPRHKATDGEAQAEAVAQAELPGGSETLLLVEDEPAVRALAGRVLRACGYTVLEAEDGEAALLAARRHEPGSIQLVLTDMMMPRLGGAAAIERLRSRYPDIQVLFMSANPTHGGQLGQIEGWPLLQKPFTALALAEAVRAALDVSPSQRLQRLV